MNAAELLVELSERGIRLVADGDRLRYHPRSALTLELLVDLKREKADLLNLLAPRSATPCVVQHVDAAQASEFYWSQISKADHSYLLGPRDYPPACAWCGGRMVHNPLCDELRQSWEPIVLFGKHLGRRVSEVPGDYLSWLVCHARIKGELREAIRRQLKFEKER